MLHGHLGYFQKPPRGGRPSTILWDHGTPNAQNWWFIMFFWCVKTGMNKNIIEIAFGWGPGHMWLHTTFEDPLPHYMILEVCLDGLWTLSFGVSQFHGHGSRLVCEVALRCWCEVDGPYIYGFILLFVIKVLLGFTILNVCVCPQMDIINMGLIP
jgi:hypothetical protein